MLALPEFAWLVLCVAFAQFVHRSPRLKRARVVADELMRGVVSKGSLMRPRVLNAVGAGPKTALKRLGVEWMCEDDKKLWLENARLQSVIGT